MADEDPDAARDEFAALRARAYGPSPDLTQVERTRLQHLEDDARIARAAPAETEPSGAAQPAKTRTGGTRPARSRRVHLVAVATVALAAVVLAGLHLQARTSAEAGASSTTSPTAAVEADGGQEAPGSSTLLEIPLGAAFGRDVDIPDRRMPEFPTDGVRWARLMGEYYGWLIWIGRGVTDDACLVAQRGGSIRARCVPDDAHLRGELLLTLSRDEIPEAERPESLTADQAVTFWWDPDGDLTVARADVSAVLDL